MDHRAIGERQAKSAFLLHSGGRHGLHEELCKLADPARTAVESGDVGPKANGVVAFDCDGTRRDVAEYEGDLPLAEGERGQFRAYERAHIGVDWQAVQGGKYRSAHRQAHQVPHTQPRFRPMLSTRGLVGACRLRRLLEPL